MVRRVLNVVYREIRGLHQAAYILALFAFGSQLLAIVRDRLLAHTFGAGIELDIYYAAFRVPDVLFVVFASILSVYVLLPFVEARREGTEEASVLSQFFTLFLLSYTVVAGVLALLAPYYLPWLFPGLLEELDQLTTLTRILLLQPFLLGLSSLCGVVTQLSHRFVLYAISPLLYNLGIILGVAALYPLLGLPGLALGVVIGACGHVLVQWPYVQLSDLRFSLVRTIEWPLVRSVFAVAVPRATTLALQQFVLLVLIGFASLMSAGSVSVFQFAFNLQSVPLAIIGMSYSVAAFPSLSRLAAEGAWERFNAQLLVALRHIVFWSVPIIALVVVLRAQIVRVLLGSGLFDWSDTRLTAAVLAIFILGLVAQAALLLLIRAFYASGRVRTPLLIACISTLVSLVLAAVFSAWYQSSVALQAVLATALRLDAVVGAEVVMLALAFVCGVILQMGLMVVATKLVFRPSFRGLARLTLHAVLAALFAGTVAYLTLQFVVDGVNQQTFVGIALQGLVAGCAGVIGAAVVYGLLDSPELREITKSFRARIFKTDIVAPEPDSL